MTRLVNNSTLENKTAFIFFRVFSVFVIIGIVFSFLSKYEATAEENAAIIASTPYVSIGQMGYGLEWSESEINMLENNNNGYAVSQNSSVDLPDRVDLSSDIYFPPIGNQGASASCASWAMAYYQYSYQVARLNNWNLKDGSNNNGLFSPQYTYNFVNEGSISNGTTQNEVAAILLTQRCIPLSEYPHDGTLAWYQGETEEETLDVLHESLKHRVTSYYRYRLDPTTSVPLITESKDSDLEQLKALLYSGHCLVFGSSIMWFRISELPNGEKICSHLRGTNYEGHAMTIVGYDDTIWCDLNNDSQQQEFEMGAIKIANSWGTNQPLENDGFLWIAYDALKRIKVCYSVSLKPLILLVFSSADAILSSNGILR